MKLIQIGANSGNDSVYKFVINNTNTIECVVLVEPVPFVIDRLADCYKDVNNVFIEQVAITDGTDKSLTMFYEVDSNYEIATLTKKHLLDHGCPEERIREIVVPTMTINELLNKHNITELDYLFIDAEGLDVHLIASIDFERFSIRNIMFESAHTDGVRTRGANYNNTVNYLHRLGYIVQNVDGLNTKATLL